MPQSSLHHPEIAFSSKLKSPCNHQCLHCAEPFFSLHAAVPPLDQEKLLHQIRAARTEGAGWIHVGGGEPTCHPGLADYIGLVHSVGLKVILRTNGYLLSSSDYAGTLLSHKIDFIYVTVHSCRAHVHDFMTRVPGSFEKTIQGVRHILEIQDREAFAVTIVITALNYMMLEEMVRYLQRLGVRMIEFCGLVNEAGKLAFPNLLVDLMCVQPHLHQAARVCRESGMAYILRSMPLCILPEEQFRWSHCVRLEGQGMGENHAKFTECGLCDLNHICSGVDRTTRLKFGEPDFLKRRSR